MERMKATVIGGNALVEIIGAAKGVPAKIDTGADSSAIWASDIHVDEKGRLHYQLFDKSAPFYNGKEHITKDFTVASVISSSGHRQIRYRAKLSLRVGGRLVRVQFNLSNRSKHRFPILIGRRTLKNKFIVDVAQQAVAPPVPRTLELNAEMQENPYAFFQKYHQTKQK